MNMFKKNGGFTLVELIVVIAILAILAGVAVPVYSGYISKANEAADVTQLDAVKTAAVFVHTENVAKNPNATTADYTVNEITVSKDGAVTVNGTTVDVTNYTTVAAFKSDKYKTNGAKWTPAGGWVENK